MDIQSDRRHTFYLDPNNNLRPLSPYHLDRLWRGDPVAAIPELANQRIRFAILHTERFTSPPNIVLEQHLVLPIDAAGNLDTHAHQAQLAADVDLLESTNDHPAAPGPASPDPATWSPISSPATAS